VKEILQDIDRWQRGGERFAVATVVATRRSAPRSPGAKLGVSTGGELAGSVSGGCVENEVYGVAQEVLEGGEPRLLTYGISDDQALEVGLPCGGEIDVFVEEADQELVDRVRRVIEEERRAVLFTVIEGEGIGDRWLAVDGEGTNAPPELAAEVDGLLRSGRSAVLEHEGRKVFAEVLEPPPRLVVIGAVDTAEALCAAARQLGWRTIVVDARAKFATPERIPSADELVVGWPDEALERVEPDYATALVVLTHEDRFDVPALRSALATEAFYIGALGSRRNQEQRRERLLEAGVEEHALERISGPSGLDIGAVSPAETAVSILAEILARRAGRTGGPLQTAAGRIHAGVD
jgi:xanthine dehydrogenase accessory factor